MARPTADGLIIADSVIFLYAFYHRHHYKQIGRENNISADFRISCVADNSALAICTRSYKKERDPSGDLNIQLS